MVIKRKNGTEKHIGTIENLGKLYDYINKGLFGNALSKPVITVQRDERNKTYGWWSVKKVWQENGEDEGAHDLNITAQQLNRPINQITATLIHEMCHQYAQANDIQDTSRGNAYHSKLFAKIAKTHGLTVECVKTIGWSHTELTANSEKLIAVFVAENPESIIYCSPVFKRYLLYVESFRCLRSRLKKVSAYERYCKVVYWFNTPKHKPFRTVKDGGIILGLR